MLSRITKKYIDQDEYSYLWRRNKVDLNLKKTHVVMTWLMVITSVKIILKIGLWFTLL